MMLRAAYDPHADWYDDYLTGDAAGYMRRIDDLLCGLLGPGDGVCLDVCCGTGARAESMRELGWTPLGVDLSRQQLRHAVRRLPVAVGDGAGLPVADGCASAAACVLAHTDLPDYPAVVREVTRALRPNGRFVHLGVHPCFVGAFADWSDRPRVVVDDRYADRSHTYDSWCPTGVRARVGAWHVPLSDLINAVTGAGLRVRRVVEEGPGGVPDVFGLLATKEALTHGDSGA